MYSVCYFGSDPNQDVIFERFRDNPQILTSVKICSVLSRSGTCIRRDTTKLLVFFFLLGKVPEKIPNANPFSFFLSVSESRH